jgi:L-lactate utilization protein LutC
MKMHKIGFPKQLYKLMQEKTNQLGVSIPEYVRHLIINDVEETADEELEAAIAKGLRDYSEKKYVIIKDKKELKEFLEEL